MNFIKLHAYKLVGVLLFIYVLCRGILTPIKPGIQDVSPSRLKAGDSVALSIKGYNTHFQTAATGLKAWLKMGTNSLLAAEHIKAVSENEAIAIFYPPANFPSKQHLASVSLIVDSDVDGPAILPSKMIISQDSTILDSLKWAALWPGKPDFHYKKNYHFPYRNILYETIRNTFFHVAIWFAMFFLLMYSVWNALKYLQTRNLDYDCKAHALVVTGIFFGLLGCATGSLWAKFTWDTWWTRDIKLNMAALSMLIYFVYLILRASIDSIDLKARISASYNVFALVAIIPLLFVLPRLTDSLHPGNGGNPAFGSEDMDNALRTVFYPAIMAFILLGYWISSLLYRINKLQVFFDERENN